MPIDYSSLPQSVLIARAARALGRLQLAPGDAAIVAEAVELAEPLASLADRMTTANDKRRAGGKAGNGRPPVGYLYDHERRGSYVVFGIKAVAELMDMSPGSVAAGITKAGGTMSRIAHDEFGEWVVSVRRATEAEERQATEELAAAESGTEAAS